MVHTIPYGATSGFPLNLLPLDFHSQGILFTIAIVQETQETHQKNLFKKNVLDMCNIAYFMTVTTVLTIWAG